MGRRAVAGTFAYPSGGELHGIAFDPERLAGAAALPRTGGHAGSSPTASPAGAVSVMGVGLLLLGGVVLRRRTTCRRTAAVNDVGHS